MGTSRNGQCTPRANPIAGSLASRPMHPGDTLRRPPPLVVRSIASLELPHERHRDAIFAGSVHHWAWSTLGVMHRFSSAIVPSLRRVMETPRVDRCWSMVNLGGCFSGKPPSSLATAHWRVFDRSAPPASDATRLTAR
jgi:hypothetical protein